jgi:hypothetical protein
LTVDTQPTSGDTLTIGSKTYIFVPVGTANVMAKSLLVPIWPELRMLLSLLLMARMESIRQTLRLQLPLSLINTSTITALIGGDGWKYHSHTETFTAETNFFAATTLGSGTDCTAANTSLVVIAAVNANTNSGVTGFCWRR